MESRAASERVALTWVLLGPVTVILPIMMSQPFPIPTRYLGRMYYLQNWTGRVTKIYLTLII